MTRIKRIPILQAAKVCGLTGFMLGGVSTGLGLVLIFVISTDSPVVTLTAMISLPLVGALLGFAGAAAACWLYNFQAGWTGGLWLDLEAGVVAVSGNAEESGISCPSPDQGESVGDGEPTSEEPEGRRVDGKSQLEQRSIRVYRMKLGPTGTGRSQNGSPSHGKPEEWFDLRNDGSASVRTSGLCLYHLEYPSPEGEPEYRFVLTLPESSLKPGEILRVHSGPRRDLSALYSEERIGADQHAFTGEDARIWNRREGDTAVLYAQATKELTDSVSYDPDPPEGVVLYRQGPKLVPTPVGAGASIGQSAGKK
jgi:hypothetical protein